MLDIMIIPVAIIPVYLLMWMSTEESFRAKDRATTIDWWESELEYRMWLREELEELSYDTPYVKPLDEVAAGMTLAGWHPAYGADGWEGIPESK